eukprot:12384887-Alexandrium_andersonii.AAC.1
MPACLHAWLRACMRSFSYASACMHASADACVNASMHARTPAYARAVELVCAHDRASARLHNYERASERASERESER